MAYQIEIDVNAKVEALEQVQKALDEINGRVGVLSKSTGKMENVMTGAMMNIGAQLSSLAMRMPSFAAATIQAFGRQEMAVQKVASAIRSQGGSVSEVLPIMQSLASEIQRITTYGDEQVLEMQSLAAAMGVASDQMAETIQNAIGLSSALGMDVMTATKAASAAIQGKTTALQEYIPSLAKCSTEAEKLATVQRLAAGGFEQARDRVDTLDGKLKQAANAWGDLQEVVGVGIGGAIRQKLHRACGKYRRFLFRFRRHLPRHRNLRICSQQGVRHARVALGEFLRVGSEFGGGVHFRRVRFGRELLENNGFKQAYKCRRSTLCKNRLPERRCVLPTDERRFGLRRLRLRHRDERHLLRQRRLVCGCRPGRVRLVGAVAERIHNPKRSPNVQGRLQADSRIQAARGFAGGVVCEQTHYVFAYAADLVAVGISTDEPRRHARRHIFGKVNADGRHAYRERKKPDNGLGGRRVDRTGAVARALQKDVDIDSVQITAGKLRKTKWHFPRNTLQLGKYRANSENELLQSEPCNHHAKTMQPPRKPNATEGLPQTSKTHIFQNLFHHSTINFRDTLSKSLKWLPAIKLLSGRYSNAPRPFEPIRESLSKIVSFDKSLPCSFKNLPTTSFPNRLEANRQIRRNSR